MKKRAYIKYKNADEIICLNGYSVSENMIKVIFTEPYPFKNCGFDLYDTNGSLVKDCSDFIYRWDILNADNTTQPNTIVFTDNMDLQQTMPFWAKEEIDKEVANTPDEPLTNEELTEAIADLICEVSLMQLNI